MIQTRDGHWLTKRRHVKDGGTAASTIENAAENVGLNDKPANWPGQQKKRRPWQRPFSSALGDRIGADGPSPASAD